MLPLGLSPGSEVSGLERSLRLHAAPARTACSECAGDPEREGHWSLLVVVSPVPRVLTVLARQIILRVTWVSPPAVTLDWKRKVAQEAIESLSASKLAKSICSQFRTRLNCSHEAFAASLRQVGL